MCREKIQIDNVKEPSVGSPLRVQGKAYGKVSTDSGTRITPACAGKSKKLSKGEQLE